MGCNLYQLGVGLLFFSVFVLEKDVVPILTCVGPPAISSVFVGALG